MTRARSGFSCQACGAVHPKWSGRCDGCGAWNTITEEAVERPRTTASRKGGLELVDLAGESALPPRLRTTIAELDRVLGGGIVPGSAILLGGDPGIGKSTLTLQAAAALARSGARVVYLTGEESIEQIRLRALRLGLADAPVQLAAATHVGEILGGLDRPPTPDLVVIDSIQTMWVETIEASPGTVSQLRAAAHELIRFAKRRGSTVLLIGHVTKDGQIAGPRVLEHMVDAVLYFEGERGHQFRLLRSVKNRFGPANEIGVFEMREQGLLEVPNPSALFLAERDEEAIGAAVLAGMEGSRPVLVEIQALVAPSPYGTPRRAVVGWDGNRLAMLIAVLEARCGIVMGNRDVYLSVTGGYRIQEPAADLAVAGALVSALTGVPLPARAVLCGEVGLGGELRAIGHLGARVREAAKLGFERALVPKLPEDEVDGITIVPMRRLIELVDLLATAPGAGVGRRPDHEARDDE